MLRTALVDLRDNDFRREFRIRAELSLQRLATIFLGHPFEAAHFREFLRSATRENYDDTAYKYLERVHQIRRLINYDHTDPASVFLLFCEFLVDHYHLLRVVGIVKDDKEKYHVAYIHPYHAPSFPGLTEFFQIKIVRDLGSNVPYLAVNRINWESFDPSRVGVLEPAPEPTEN